MNSPSADMREVWKRLAESGEVAIMFSDNDGGLISAEKMQGVPHVFCRMIHRVTAAGYPYVEPFIGSAMQGCRE